MSDRASCPECLAVFRGGFLRCPRDGTELVRTERDPLIGTVLAERYQIESVIGEGGIGRVYRARHVRMSRRFAIKVPFGELAYDTKVRTRFLHEAEATSRLSHTNVIGVVDVGESPKGLLYLAMDLAEGTSLAEVIQREGPLPRRRVLSIATQIAEGLGHAHERNLVHRDLKPENIILVAEEAGERVCLVDFGIAILRDADGQSGRLTTEGIVLGTPHYMSPEQATNGTIDHRTDLFALGLIIYEMLAGVLPFDGTPVEVARKNLGAEAPRITTRVPGLVPDRHLEALAFWLMKKRPDARPQRAAEVVEVLRLIATDPDAASARLQLGELDEIEDLPAPKGVVRKRTPAPAPPKRDTIAGVGPGGVVRPSPQAPQAERYEPEETEEVAPGKHRLLWAILVSLLFAAIAITVIATQRGSGDATAAAPRDAGSTPIALVTPDAARATPDAAPLPDAAPAPIAPDAGIPRAHPRHPTGANNTSGGTKPPPPPHVDAGVPAAPEAPTSASLTALYDQVGKKLNSLVAAKGKAAIAPFQKRYGDVPYLEASRKPELRAEAMAKLRALSHDLDALR